MKTKKILVPTLGLFIAALMPNYASAFIWLNTDGNPIPAAAIYTQGNSQKVNICHANSGGSGFSYIGVDFSSLNGHDVHNSPTANPGEDYFDVGTNGNHICYGLEPPTADNKITLYQQPIDLTGSVGGSMSNATIVNVALVNAGANHTFVLSPVTTTNHTWLVSSGALNAGTYSITARDTQDLTNTIPATLTVCAQGQIISNGICASVGTPSVDTINSDNPFDINRGGANHNWLNSSVDIISSNNSSDIARSGADYNWLGLSIEDTTPTISGTIGSVALDLNSSFAVTITNAAGATVYDSAGGGLTVNGTSWSFTSTALAAGIYHVNAIRTQSGSIIPDPTNNELIVGIAICEENVDKYVLRPDWVQTRESTALAPLYYLGRCNASPALPPTPGSLGAVDVGTEGTTPICNTTEGGGVRNTHAISNATVTSASIMDATITNGTIINLLDHNAVIYQYGEKLSQSGSMDISTAIIDPNVTGNTGSAASGVNLTGVTLNNVYVNAAGAFNTSTGGFSTDATWIKVTGAINGTISSGVITAGVDSNSNQIRGRLTRGGFISTGATQSIKGRRVQGVLEGATISNATTITSTTNGVTKTVVIDGTIEAGTFTTSTAYGVITDATFTGTVSPANHCFSSGTVGSRGTLNWKEKK